MDRKSTKLHHRHRPPFQWSVITARSDRFRMPGTVSALGRSPSINFPNDACSQSSVLNTSNQSLFEPPVLFGGGVRKCRLSRRGRVVVRNGFGELAGGQVPLHAMNHVVEVRAARGLGAEYVAAKTILNDQRCDAAMVLRRIGGRPCTGRARCVRRP